MPRLGDVERRRADFIVSVSHDLQTPLTVIEAGLHLLQASAAGRLETAI